MLRTSLNPCFNGRYSQRDTILERNRKKARVLILVLMEDTLRAECGMERDQSNSLNPCFNGRYSQSGQALYNVGLNIVLILVLMEDTLRVFYMCTSITF